MDYLNVQCNIYYIDTPVCPWILDSVDNITGHIVQGKHGSWSNENIYENPVFKTFEIS